MLNYINENNHPIPAVQGLNLKNYPNPFNPITTIEFTISTESAVSIDIFNIRGQVVKSFPQKIYFSGKNTVQGDGLNNYRTTLASGIYLYQVKIDSGLSEVKKMVFLK
ncbi:MAG: T9SS type A sorting domain-containing protein [Candidatus Cloacimonetes bacterium]|nr:T9SS type A sorting domain-containing protein [Candidatus Cloacimonadota bacterium]